MELRPWQPATRGLTPQRICGTTTPHRGLILKGRTASCHGSCRVCTELSLKVRRSEIDFTGKYVNTFGIWQDYGHSSYFTSHVILNPRTSRISVFSIQCDGEHMLTRTTAQHQDCMATQIPADLWNCATSLIHSFVYGGWGVVGGTT